MRLLYSTEPFPSRSKFKLWRELMAEHFRAYEHTRLDDREFSGKLEATRIGSLPISRFAQSAAEQKARQERPCHAADTVTAIFKLSGTTTGTIQEDRAAVQRPGDMVLLNRRPLTLGTPEAGQSLMVELPRARLERVLGPSSL